MTTSESPRHHVPLNQSIPRLRRRVTRLERLSGRKLDQAICDLIDVGGRSLAVLLATMPLQSSRVRHRVARRIEDFLYFHPRAGRKLMGRLVTSCRAADHETLPHLLSALADVMHQVRPREPVAPRLQEQIFAVLRSDADFPRKGKAAELGSRAGSPALIPLLLRNLPEAMQNLGEFAHYQFTETTLFSLKRLAGESFLRLLIHPDSVEARRQFRIERRTFADAERVAALDALRLLPDDAPEILLKVIELSEFSLPFLPMILEGLAHENKWVRQMATAAMQRLEGEIGPGELDRLLSDPAPEVRLMAVTSMGGYPADQTGERLVAIGASPEEPPEIRLNALYALYSQKNSVGLGKVMKNASPQIAMNAQGLAAMLLPRLDGLKALLKTYTGAVASQGNELFPFLLELAKVEDLPLLLQFYADLPDDQRKKTPEQDGFLRFLSGFLQAKAGEPLERFIERLPEDSQKTIRLLQGKV